MFGKFRDKIGQQLILAGKRISSDKNVDITKENEKCDIHDRGTISVDNITSLQKVNTEQKLTKVDDDIQVNGSEEDPIRLSDTEFDFSALNITGYDAELKNLETKQNLEIDYDKEIAPIQLSDMDFDFTAVNGTDFDTDLKESDAKTFLEKNYDKKMNANLLDYGEVSKKSSDNEHEGKAAENKDEEQRGGDADYDPMIYNSDKGIKISIGSSGDKIYTEDFQKISHMIVTGTTGSGKTAFMQNILCEMVNAYSPKEIELIVFDSKKVDYAFMQGIPHMLIPVITDGERMGAVIAWAYAEAQVRLEKIGILGHINYLPHIFIVIDDFFDISFDEVNENLEKFLSIANKVKMHCIIVTSTPSASIVSTIIKSFIPYKIAFRTATKSISRMVIDRDGAEILNLPGEMIYVRPSERIRCNSVYKEYDIIADECEKIKRAAVEIVNNADNMNEKSNQSNNAVDKEYDSLLGEVGKFIIETNKSTIGGIQRKFRIGFNRAARIVDALTELGVVGPERGTMPREIVMTLEEFNKLREKYKL